VVGTLIWLEEYGDRLVPDIEAKFLAYIDELLKGGTLIAETTVFDNLHYAGWAIHDYHKNDHPTFKKVRAHLQKAVGSAHKLDMAEEAKKLLHRLRTPGSESDLYEFDRRSGQFGCVALLQNIAISDFADILVKDSLYDTPLITALHQRYWLRSCPELIEEKPWLVDLEAEMRRRAEMARAPFHCLLQQQTDYWFGDIRKNMGLIEELSAATGAVPNADPI
jgi:hypothetical protein